MLRTTETWCYRFYSNNSNFIHGGIDGRPEEQQAVTGQAVSIHSVYQCLNVITVTQCIVSVAVFAVSVSMPCCALLCLLLMCDGEELDISSIHS